MSRGRSFERTWTEAEIEKLRESFSVVKRKKDWAAILPGHSWSGIVQKARALGLRKKLVIIYLTEQPARGSF